MPGEPVLLYQYDLSNGMAQSMGHMLIGRPVEGIWHTSIVAYNVEIWFGQGIHSKAPPGTTHHGAPRKKIRLGETQLDKDTFFEYIEGMRETYRAERYHLLEFNCNHFSNDVIGFLNGGSIPREILDQPKELMATPFGQQMRPMIEQMFVGANNRSAGDAVNNILPSLANGSTPSRSTQSNDDVPSAQSIQSNLQIVTSIASLRSTFSRSKATAIMYTSASCPPCNAIKPHFEELARTHHKITFCLVETGLGEGGQVAKLSEFGGPVSATPTFVFFKGVEKVGECKGADRRELETQVGMLALEAFPPHPHEKLSLPALGKLTKTLSPVTFLSFPPLPALSAKLATSTASLDASVSSVLTKQVIPYLSALPAPPAKSSSPFPSTLLDPWLSSTLTALSSLPDPSSKFPVLDLIRLSLARDHTRLSTQPAFLSFLPKLLSQLVLDLDIDSPSHAYLLTSLRLFSNALLSPILTSRLLAPDCLPNMTKLLIRALLDTEEKMRSAGAGLGWSVIAKVYERRIAGEGEGEGEASGVGEEWEVEVAGALLEALGREECSMEVVHRLTATLGLLLYRSPFSEELKSFLEVLEGRATLETKEKAIEGMKGEEKDKKEVKGLIADVKKLMA